MSQKCHISVTKVSQKCHLEMDPEVNVVVEFVVDVTVEFYVYFVV